MYKLTRFGQSRLALTGVQWRDLTDEEYAKAVERHPGMEDHGYFVKEEPEAEEAPRRRTQRGTTFSEPQSEPPEVTMTIKQEETDG